LKHFLIFLYCFAGTTYAQTISQCKQRFDTYLNFKGLLNPLVKFEGDAIYLLNGNGEKEFAVYAHELGAVAAFFENSDLKQQEAFVKRKGIKKFTSRQRDSLFISVDEKFDLPKYPGTKTLQGCRIALDPGHFATTAADAQIEQKYLYFVKDSINHPLDTVKLFESHLTFKTAQILKNMLEEQGAEVLLTRNFANYTSFNCTYSYWLKTHKKRTLDSLKTSGQLSPGKHAKLLKSSDYLLFWDFFRDFDLANRANKMNRFHPHASVVIHYNVDEKNDPWKKATPKNYCMAFIAGAFTADNLDKTESRLHFLRLLLTDQLNRSEQLAGNTVKSFHTNLGIPVAAATDADYLSANCLFTGSDGVFSRNLILCRKISSVLVYGESLYQDNERECEELMRCDTDLYGVASNTRLINVAKSYYEALLQLLKNR
jgi:N-acetylmuramoyl-L-alanine amidase